MILDVSQILKETGGKIDIETKLDFADVDFLGENFHFEEPLNLSGKIYNNGKSLRLTLDVTGKMQVHCARCMKPMVTDVDFEVSEDFMQGDGETAEEDDIILFEGTKIELLEVVSNSFFMNVSGKYLCSEDCKGLCPHCGKNLNEGDCGCEDDDIDPRWAGLKAIMDKTDSE
jgi:uncharacterized protein